MYICLCVRSQYKYSLTTLVGTTACALLFALLQPVFLSKEQRTELALKKRQEAAQEQRRRMEVRGATPSGKSGSRCSGVGVGALERD